MIKSSIYPRLKSAYRNGKEVVSFLVNPGKYAERTKSVGLGWQQKVGDKMVEAQLPEPVVKSMPTVARGCAYFMMAMLPLGTVSTIAQELSAHAEGKAKVVSNLMKAKATSMAEDSLVFDSKIPLPLKLYNAVKNETTLVGRFFKSIKANKDSLVRDLGISSEEYNEYAAVAIKLSKEESQYGNAKSYKMYDAVERYDLGRNLISTARKVSRGDGDLSLGMTRFKINKASDEEKLLFDKYGITYGDNGSNIIEPEKSAIATMIHLATLGRDYPKYLENARKLYPDITNPAVKNSIKNSKEILFNDVYRPKAVTLLQGGERAVEENFLDAGFIPIEVSEKDLNDLRTYASTVILSKEAYLAGRWNGRKLLPEGTRKDQACANLLNVANQKGYVANIDKKSEVLY